MVYMHISTDIFSTQALEIHWRENCTNPGVIARTITLWDIHIICIFYSRHCDFRAGSRSWKRRQIGKVWTYHHCNTTNVVQQVAITAGNNSAIRNISSAVAQCAEQQAPICSNVYGGWFAPRAHHSVRMTYRPSAALRLLGSLRISHDKFLRANKWILILVSRLQV